MRRARWAEARERTGWAQCCMNTAQCAHRMTPEEKEERCKDVPGFEPSYDSRHEPMNNTAPLYLFLASIIFVARWIYDSGNCCCAQVGGERAMPHSYRF